MHVCVCVSRKETDDEQGGFPQCLWWWCRETASATATRLQTWERMAIGITREGEGEEEEEEEMGKEISQAARAHHCDTTDRGMRERAPTDRGMRERARCASVPLACPNW